MVRRDLCIGRDQFGLSHPIIARLCGGYHYLAVLALSAWGVERSPALAYGIGTHALNMIANVSLGAFFVAREGVSLHDLRTETVE